MIITAAYIVLFAYAKEAGTHWLALTALVLVGITDVYLTYRYKD